MERHWSCITFSEWVSRSINSLFVSFCLQVAIHTSFGIECNIHVDSKTTVNVCDIDPVANLVARGRLAKCYFYTFVRAAFLMSTTTHTSVTPGLPVIQSCVWIQIISITSKLLTSFKVFSYVD